ncbi:heterogeneous nuclear ribonucleoprotein 1-like [Glycine max]|uniref:Heterogeneous nuclear ribonucleoprotein 1 isoform B n=1 Tax=Glycine soja TaxID=3848 RepID=A0A445L951_GLYSO|nr:heterogeneous nuclear ribonucleoprotein 1-like [Glycine max]RZC19667.1 Heterogeneous nuclear ribonucleoprotein 1 isoform B [Glycine soja]
MDSDQGKLFIGGISWDTTEDKLKEHFGNYDDVLSTSVMREKNTGKPRGFGFVVFADPNILDRVMEDKHVIDGRTCNRQKGITECGYYVMHWMSTIILGSFRNNWETYFNEVRPLEAERFKALRIQWAQYYLKVRNQT